MSQIWYEYEPLEEDEIRLLELFSGEDGQPLQGRLCTFRLPPDEEVLGQEQVLLTRAEGVTIPPPPAFQALSYTWGTLRPDPYRLKLFAHQGFRDLAIQTNLYTALRRLRTDIEPGQSSFYWIDAICIQQDNIPEKNLQIQKMAMVYHRAERVIIWLGEDDKDSAKAMEFVHRVKDLSHFDPLTRDKSASAEWAALMNLMQRDWFSRRWIVQEVAFARDAWLYCGSQSVSWRSFSCVVALFASRSPDLRQLFQRSENYDNHPNYIGEVDALGAKALVDITNNLFRKSRDGKVLERLCSLQSLMCILTSFETKLPHDAIYSVLWLAYDAEPASKDRAALAHESVVKTPIGSPQFLAVGSPEENPPPESLDDWRATKRRRLPSFESSPGQDLETNGVETSTARQFGPSDIPPSQHADSLRLKPPSRAPTGLSAGDNSLQQAESGFDFNPAAILVDYSKPFYEVCTQFMDFAIAKSRSLDILCHPWAPEPLDGDEPLPSWIAPVSNAPFEKEPFRNAYGRVRADPLVGVPGSGIRNYNACGKTKASSSRLINGRILTVGGFVLDTIAEMRDTAHEGIIPHSWLSLVDWYGTSEEIPDILSRALVADRGPGGRHQQPPYFWLACKWLFEQKKPRGGINTTSLMTSGRCPSIVSEYLRRVQAVIRNRKLILGGTRKGSEVILGLAPESARPGDLLCILYGCSVPVVLRKNKKRTLENGDNAAYPFSRTVTAEPLSTNGNLKVPKERTPKSELRSGLDVPDLQLDTQFGSLGVRKRLEPTSTTPTLSPQDLPPLTKETSIPDASRTYTFIGEAYIQNFMGGEAFKHQKDFKIPNHLFNLV